LSFGTRFSNETSCGSGEKMRSFVPITVLVWPPTRRDGRLC
jgi:hypothetical protein